MNNKNIQQNAAALYNPTPLRVLSFFSLNPRGHFSAKEISRNTAASKGATHQALRLLLDRDIITRYQKGNVFLYGVSEGNRTLKAFKMFENLLNLEPLVKQLKPYIYQIILFGSCASGDNTAVSDVDLFIKASNKEAAEKIVKVFVRSGSRVNAVIYEPLELIRVQKEEKAFFEQIKKGIVVWEGEPDHGKN